MSDLVLSLSKDERAHAGASLETPLRGRLRMTAASRSNSSRGRPYSTGHGGAFQIPLAYSWIVRSLENLPEAAMLRITLRVHSSG